MHSSEFAHPWATGDVADCTSGPMNLQHPTLGSIDVDYHIWLQPDSPDHRLEVYTPRDETSRDALNTSGTYLGVSIGADVGVHQVRWPGARVLQGALGYSKPTAVRTMSARLRAVIRRATTVPRVASKRPLA